MDFSENMSMCMMNTMMHIFVRVIISCTIAPPIEMGIGNTKAAEKSVRDVNICLSVQQAKIM